MNDTNMGFAWLSEAHLVEPDRLDVFQCSECLGYHDPQDICDANGMCPGCGVVFVEHQPDLKTKCQYSIDVGMQCVGSCTPRTNCVYFKRLGQKSPCED